MPRYLQTIAVHQFTPSADGVQRHDLGVNPLSMLLINLRPLNETTSAADFQNYLGICSALTKIQVLKNGVSVMSMSGRDAAALAYFRNGIVPHQQNANATNNERRSVVLPILFGRFPFDRKSCFPASRRGEVCLELDVDIASTGFDGLQLSVEQVELPDAKPSEFERRVTINSTLALGKNDVELPMGHKLRGCLLYGTTAYTGAAPAPTIGRVSLKVDNEQTNIAASDFETLAMMHTLWGRQPPAMDQRVGTATQDCVAVGMGGWQNYAFMDFDPDREDTFTPHTKSASRVHLEIDAEAAEAIRVIPIEALPPSAV